MPKEKLKVVLCDLSGNEDIVGELIVDDSENPPLNLPAEFPIEAGKCKLEARCPGRSIKGENPREIEVKVRTKPNVPVQKVIFEVS
jgi:hypothetical protein